MEYIFSLLYTYAQAYTHRYIHIHTEINTLTSMYVYICTLAFLCSFLAIFLHTSVLYYYYYFQDRLSLCSSDVMELALYTLLAPNSEIQLLWPPQMLGLKVWDDTCLTHFILSYSAALDIGVFGELAIV